MLQPSLYLALQFFFDTSKERDFIKSQKTILGSWLYKTPLLAHNQCIFGSAHFTSACMEGNYFHERGTNSE